MAGPATLVDALLRESYQPRSSLYRTTPRPATDLRAALVRARRFVLDDAMAAFMADLSSVPFQAARVRNPEVLDTLRHGARLPHPATWVEFSGRAFRERLLQITEGKTDITGRPMRGLDGTVPRWGWLLEEHPQMPQAVRLSEFADLGGGKVCGLPFHWVWNTRDDPLPWPADTRAGELAHGVQGYQSPHIGVVYDRETPEDRRVRVRHEGEEELDYSTDRLVVEMAGVVRYALAFLATLNDIPTTTHRVEVARGFVARGSYHRYLEHTVVRLSVPAQFDARRLARRLVVIARRRAHQVRGHWRLYERGEGTPCADHAHAWGPADENGHAPCRQCPAWRTWIAEHQRGDASLGFVTHDYAVTHGDRETVN